MLDFQLIRDVLDKNHKPVKSPGRPAGVFLLLVDLNDSIHLILQKRIKDRSPHSGQISLIGGSSEPFDKSILETAYREAKEEVGVGPSDIELLGALRPTITLRSGFAVYPFVGRLLGNVELRPNPSEVERLIYIPVQKLIDLHPFRRKSYYYDGARRETFIIEHDGEIVWGATARILDDFISRLKERLSNGVPNAKGKG